jgi:hypothetical protein
MSTATGTRTATKTRFATERSVPAEDDLRGADAVGERMAEERAGSDTPITLVAVRRHWPEAPRGEPRTALESWRSDSG